MCHSSFGWVTWVVRVPRLAPVGASRMRAALGYATARAVLGSHSTTGSESISGGDRSPWQGRQSEVYRRVARSCGDHPVAHEEVLDEDVTAEVVGSVTSSSMGVWASLRGLEGPLTALLTCGAVLTWFFVNPGWPSADVSAGPRVLRPAPAAAGDDKGGLAGDLCIDGYRSDSDSCTYGPADAAVHLAVVGDSKMHQWLPALQSAADEYGWRLTTSLKDACGLYDGDTTVEADGVAYSACVERNEARMAWLLEDDSIDYVLVSQRASRAFAPDASPEAQRAMLIDGTQRAWRRLESAGRDVIVFLDNPAPSQNIPDCVAQHVDDPSRCDFDATEGAGRSGAQVQRAAAEGAGVDIVDLAPWVCPEGRCPAVVGDVLAYRQGSHLTATYVETLASQLGAALAEVVHG